MSKGKIVTEITGMCILAFIGLLLLKTVGKTLHFYLGIDLSWWWVFSPLWIPISILLFILLFVALVQYIISSSCFVKYFSGQNSRKIQETPQSDTQKQSTEQ